MDEDWYTDEDTEADIAEMEAVTDHMLAVADLGIPDVFADLVGA